MFNTCINIPSDISKLIEIEEFIDSIMQDCNLPENLRGRITLPLMEAVRNAITHGNGNDSCKTVRIICQQEAQKITFSILDEGKGFNARELLSEGKTANTHGLAVLRSLCDEMAFQNDGSTLVFRLHIPVKQEFPNHSMPFESIKKLHPEIYTDNHGSKH